MNIHRHHHIHKQRRKNQIQTDDVKHQSQRLIFVDYGDLFKQHEPTENRDIHYRQCHTLLLLHSLLHSFSNDANTVARLLTFFITRNDKQSTSMKRNHLDFWRYFINQFKNYPTTLHQFFTSLCTLFSDGIRAAHSKLEGRLTARGVTTAFVQKWRTKLKLIMAANDLCEGLIACTKALHHLSHAYDHKIAGDLVSFHLNKTKSILSDPHATASAETHIFSKSLRSMHKDEQERRRQKNIDLYNMKKKKSADEKRQLMDKKQKRIAKYNHYNELFGKGLFGASEREFKTKYSEYAASFAGRRANVITKKKDYIKERLRYFVHCVDLRSDCHITLNVRLQKLEDKMYEICANYGIWENGSYIRVRDAYLRRLEEPVGLFQDVANIRAASEYHYHYENAEGVTRRDDDRNVPQPPQDNAIGSFSAILPALHLFDHQEMPDPE